MHQKASGRETPLDVDNYPIAPADLVLEQVHVFVRHGERTPVAVRMSEPPASIPAFWPLCKTGREFKAAVATVIDGAVNATPLAKDALTLRRSVERSNGSFSDDDCMLGELTDTGRRSTFNFGTALRDLYVKKLGFLPDVIENPEAIYFRSTYMPRTIESLQQIVHGLYPDSKFGKDIIPRILIRNSRDENLYGNMLGCRRLAALNVEFAHAAAIAMRHTLEPLDEKLSKYIGGKPIRIDGSPRASGILDTIASARANGLKIPPEFENKTIMDVLERAVVTEWFTGYKTEEFRRLAMGRLLEDLGRKMGKKAESGRKDKSKFLVHSTHDTAIAGLLQTLDVFDEKWPAFTAFITFELFRKQDSEPSSLLSNLSSIISRKSGTRTDHYVRMRYQNRTLSLPICADKGSHLEGAPEFCSLATFQRRVAELTPKDWEQECNTPTGA